MAEEVKLTERELAIAQGRDPDVIALPDETLPDDAAPSTATVTDEQPGTDASNTGGGTEAAAAPPATWLTDDVKQLAASYGLADDDLKDFSSAGEFNKFARLTDRRLAADADRARKAWEAKQAEQQAQNTATTQAVENAKVAAKLVKIDLEKRKASGYDEEAIDIFAKHNELVDYVEQSRAEREAEQNRFQHLEQQFQHFQGYAAQAEWQRQLDSFHDSVDALENSRYGKSVGADGRPLRLNQAEDEARRKLFEASRQVAANIARVPGVPLPSNKVLLQRAEQLAFAEDIRAEERRKMAESISEQSKRRRPVASARQPNGHVAPTKTNQHKTVNDLVAEVINNPEVVAADKRARELSGVGA